MPEPLSSFPDTFKCACGIEHTFGAYVAAHASERLIHTCPSCGAKHVIIHYRVRCIKRPTAEIKAARNAKARERRAAKKNLQKS